MKDENIIFISGLVTTIVFLIIICFDMNKPIEHSTLRYEDIVRIENEIW